LTDRQVELILASTSPRRHELIPLLGLPFRIVASRYEEPLPPAEPVDLARFAMDLAANKAGEVSRRLRTGWVLGADTLVSLDTDVGVALAKPIDRADARRMLELLSGRAHFVYTGVALVPEWTDAEQPEPVCTFARTRVWFRDLSSEMIERYISTGEPMDKAGAYGAQGYAAPFIERVDGDFYNVVGLPLCETGRLLERCGLTWQSGAPRASAGG